MAGYVVTADISVHAPRLSEFLRLVRANAAAALGGEAGCRRFDVCRARDGAPRIFVFELYDDEAAFKVHLETAHYRAFAAAAADMVASRQITVFDLVEDSTAEVLGELPAG